MPVYLQPVPWTQTPWDHECNEKKIGEGSIPCRNPNADVVDAVYHVRGVDNNSSKRPLKERCERSSVPQRRLRLLFQNAYGKFM